MDRNAEIRFALISDERGARHGDESVRGFGGANRGLAARLTTKPGDPWPPKGATSMMGRV